MWSIYTEPRQCPNALCFNALKERGHLPHHCKPLMMGTNDATEIYVDTGDDQTDNSAKGRQRSYHVSLTGAIDGSRCII